MTCLDDSRLDVGHESRTPLSFKPFQRSGSKNLLTVTSSASPLRLLVLSTKSRAVAIAGAISKGLVLTSRSNGSPGTTLHLSNTRLMEAWPCVWIRRSVSKPKESMTGINDLVLCSVRDTYNGCGAENVDSLSRHEIDDDAERKPDVC